MPTSQNWLFISFVSMLCLIPAWLSISFFQKNYHVPPSVFLVWYMLGVAITSVSFGGAPLSALLPSWKIVASVAFIGLSIGALANILLFRAVTIAPNPGLPVAIANVASVGVFLSSIILARWLPKYFASVKSDPWALLGIILTVIGASLIGIRR